MPPSQQPQTAHNLRPPAFAPQCARLPGRLCEPPPARLPDHLAQERHAADAGTRALCPYRVLRLFFSRRADSREHTKIRPSFARREQRTPFYIASTCFRMLEADPVWR
eukprot:2213881-Pleurochrysis_carterae.AAC.3